MAKHTAMLDRFKKVHASGRCGYFGLAKLLPDALEGEEEDISEPVIDGMGAKYNEVMEHKGELVVFNQACFADSIKADRNILLCADHDQNCVLADRNSGFTVYETNEGVTFRSDVRRSKNPLALLGIVASKNRRSASVQCDIQESEIHDCGGKPVRFITKAKLNEISLVKLGRNVPAFAFITDGDKHAAPKAGVRSASFAKHQAAYMAERTGTSVAPNDSSETHGGYTTAQWNALSVRVDALETRILSARLDAIEEQLGIPSEAAHKASIASILRGEHNPVYMSLAGFRDQWKYRDQWK